MRKFMSIVYFAFFVLIVANIVSVIINWNKVEMYSFLGFEVKKFYYLIIYLLFALSFGSSLVGLLKKGKAEEK